jgi:4-hydroxythreonine-4-phosphate dehydrogenase
MGAIRFGPAFVPSRERPEEAVEHLLERGYSACEVDCGGGFWMSWEYASRLARLAADADIALSLHAPIAGFLGHRERGKKLRMAVGMLDHSAGLARALGAAHPGPGAAAPPPRDDGAPAGTLVVVGSANVVAREQMQRLLAAGVPHAGLGLSELGVGAVEACAAQARRALARDGACVVHPVGTGEGPDLPRRIAEALAEVTVRLAEDGLVGGLVLTGGDTAVGVARALGATGLRVDDELEPGVPIGRLLGPRAYRVVTKAGGFGSPDVLRTACEALAGSRRST